MRQHHCTITPAIVRSTAQAAFREALPWWDSGRVVTVYNLRVADFHTYFVGSRDWSWSVWAHYSYTALREEGLSKSQAKRANMLYKTQGEAAARAYLEGQGFSGPRLDTLANAAATHRRTTRTKRYKWSRRHDSPDGL